MPTPLPQVRAYLAALPPDARRRVKQRLDDRVLVWYAGWKQHASLSRSWRGSDAR